MAYAPIALIIPEYDRTLYANWWLKAYNAGTTTPLAMATDATGGTTAAKYELDTQGFPITAGAARLIPFIDGDYDLWLFPTAAEADANDTTNAIQFADNLNADPLSSGAVVTVGTVALLRLETPDQTVTTYLDTHTTAGDGGWGNFYAVTGAAPGTYVDNNGTIIVPNGGDGSSAFLREYSDALTPQMFGANTSNTDAENTTAIDALIAAAPAHSTIMIDEDYGCNGMTITNKTDITIGGKGSLTLPVSAASSRIFDLVGTIDNLTIRDLTLAGSNGNTLTQQAIGNTSGQTLTNLRYLNLNIKEINGGIIQNNTTGSTDKVLVQGCNLKDILGIAAGVGYGIHSDGVTNLRVMHNVIDNSERHALYQAKGDNAYNVWAFNEILNHRQNVATATEAAAVKIARSSYVKFIGNTLTDCYDGMMTINSTENVTGDNNCHHIEVASNGLYGRKNVVSAIYIGQNDIPVAISTAYIHIHDNEFVDDSAVSGGGTLIDIRNGRHLQIKDNSFLITNVSAGNNFITLGDNGLIGADDDCENTEITGNSFVPTGTSPSSARGVNIASDISTNTSKHVIRNKCYSDMIPVSHASIPTNRNISATDEFKPAAIINSTGAGVAAGSTAGYAKTTVQIAMHYDGSIKAKTVGDNLWDLTGISTGASEYKKVLLCFEAGTARVIEGEAATSQLAAPIPSVPDWDWSPIGVVELPPSYAGGSIAALTIYDITGKLNN